MLSYQPKPSWSSDITMIIGCSRLTTIRIVSDSYGIGTIKKAQKYFWDIICQQKHVLIFKLWSVDNIFVY